MNTTWKSWTLDPIRHDADLDLRVTACFMLFDFVDPDDSRIERGKPVTCLWCLNGKETACCI